MPDEMNDAPIWAEYHLEVIKLMVAGTTMVVWLGHILLLHLGLTVCCGGLVYALLNKTQISTERFDLADG